MKWLLVVLLVPSLLFGCSRSSEAGPTTINGLTWKQLPCPNYQTQSGLYRIEDPDNGNTIYIHLGNAESSIYVVPAKPTR